MDESFDLVVVSQVIEHVTFPFQVADEAYRVLKWGGRLYVSSPWIYPHHGGDKYRFSDEGLRLLCHRFSQVEVGSLDGPLHALGIILSLVVANTLSFGNSRARLLLSVPLSWLILPILLADRVFNRRLKARFVLDANLYAVATKGKPE